MLLPLWLSFLKRIRVARGHWPAHLRDRLIVANRGVPRTPRTLTAVLVLTAAASPQTTAKRKLYIDREQGASFSYPSTWLLNADDDAATAKLRITLEGQPSAVVQLEGSFTGEGLYKDTDFEAGAFAYLVTESDSQQACFNRLDRIAQTQSSPTRLAGRSSAQEARFSGMAAGTEDLHHALAVFRSGKCFLFETTLIRRAADTVEKPLPAAAWTRLSATFDSILRSVRLSPPRQL